MTRRIGLFGGTFDPIHLGHLHLALELKEKGGLEEVWCIPAATPPLREQEKLTPYTKRVEMTRLAVEGIPGFKVVEIEGEREGISYTIDTVNEIFEKFPDEEFVLLLGEDAALLLPSWKEGKKLVEKIPLLIGCRAKIDLKKRIEDPAFPPEIREAIRKAIREIPMMDIEGKIIRKRLKEKLYCNHLLPPKVLDYISENQLYYSFS